MFRLGVHSSSKHQQADQSWASNVKTYRVILYLYIWSLKQVYTRKYCALFSHSVSTSLHYSTITFSIVSLENTCMAYSYWLSLFYLDLAHIGLYGPLHPYVRGCKSCLFSPYISVCYILALSTTTHQLSSSMR
jgi:hypothetical protein